MDEANKPDKIEKLVQEAAEGAQFEFNTESWEAMEAKLDGKSWRTGARWKFGLPILLITILAVLFWPIGDGNKDVADQTEQLEKPNNETDLTAEINEEKETFEVEAQSATREEQKQNLSASSNANFRGSEQVVDNGNSRDADDPLVSTSRLLINKLKQGASSRVESVEPVEYFTEADEEKLNAGLQGNVSLEKIGIGSRAVYPWLLPSIVPMQIDSAQVEVDSLGADFRRFTYGIVLSLDLSATSLEGFTDPGNMVGVLGEYRVSRDWAIQSGVAYSTKIYSALGYEYETPYWALNAPEDFASVLAKCLVIDIPLNVKRYFTTQKGNQWFLSGGISSYFMLREDYTYNYSASRPAWPNTWTYENKNNHFFGIMNISGGIVRPLTKKLNVNIEPFMKLPLTGIGEGGVKFLSFGTNVSITIK